MRNLRLVTEECDVALCARWTRDRDESAVAILWKRHERLAVHLTARILHRLPDAVERAREICDEAFVDALRTFRPERAGTSEAPFRMWFLTIARRRALDRVRKKQPPSGGAAHEANVAPAQAKRLLEEEEIERVRSWVLKWFLPSDWEAIQRYAEGYSWEEIAQAHPISIDEVIPFAEASAEPVSREWISPVSSLLERCPRAEVRIIGAQRASGADAQPGLGLARAKRVRAMLVDRSPRLGHRLTVLSSEGDTPAVHFEIWKGARRSPDAQRVHTQTLLQRVRRISGSR